MPCDTIFSFFQDTRRRDHISGINTIQYKVPSRYDLMIGEAPVTILNVELTCDMLRTPWCVFPDQLEETLNDLRGNGIISDEDINKIKNELSKFRSYQEANVRVF